MKHELKIIMTYDDSTDQAGTRTITITTPKVLVSIDDTPIGCIQEIKFEAFAHNMFPRLEVVFPNLRDTNIDTGAALPNTFTAPNTFLYEIDKYVREFSAIPNTKVSLQNLNPTVKVFHLEEVGTDGFIDSFPMKNRNEAERVFRPLDLTFFKPKKN